jgi:hypothetical protein
MVVVHLIRGRVGGAGKKGSMETVQELYKAARVGG